MASTDAAALPRGVVSEQAVNRSGFAQTFLVALIAVFAMSLPNLADPIIRWDDYPALFGDAAMFWNKTLHEGRWLNYIWHLRGWLAPAWLNFAIYQFMWAALAAGIATVAFRDERRVFLRAAFAVAIAVSPSALFLSLWFNTLMPGLGLVAIYAVMACYASPRIVVWLLPPFVVATFMAYTTYPLILLAICLMRQDTKSFWRLFFLLGLFTASIIAAVIITYTLNWYVHGIFGVPLADWRDATPAEGLEGLADNLSVLWLGTTHLGAAFSYRYEPAIIAHAVLFLGSAGVLIKHRRNEAMYIYAGLFVGLVMVAAQVLKLGVQVPTRAFLFVWIFHWFALVRAVSIVMERPDFLGRYAFKGVVLLIGVHLMLNVQNYAKYRDWQQETRELNAILETAPQPIYVRYYPLYAPAGRQADIQSNHALNFRLNQLSGVQTVLCAEFPEDCATLPEPTASRTQFHVTALPDGLGTVVSYPLSFHSPR